MKHLRRLLSLAALLLLLVNRSTPLKPDIVKFINSGLPAGSAK